MKVGIVYPQTETGGDPDALDKIGRAAEDLGFDSLLMYDHVVGAVHEGRDPPLWGPYTERDPFHDPLMAFSYLAGLTKRIEFITGVLILPQRQTVLVAKQTADLDLVSRGRLTLGVGSGWNYVEYDALGEDFHTRGKKLDEQIPYLRRLWSEPLLTFDGQFHHIDRGNIIPRPKRQIPIFCGGFGEAPYRRAAKMADGFIFSGNFVETALPGLLRVRKLLAEQERAVESFGLHLIMHGERGKGLDIQGSVDALRRWQDEGGTQASIRSMDRGFQTPEEHIDFVGEVRLRFKQ